jgi:hypothetical protein
MPSAIKRLFLAAIVCILPVHQSVAEDDASRFFEIKEDTSIKTYDISTVQYVVPGRFTVNSTTISNPDVMKYELDVQGVLKGFCGRPEGEYLAPENIFSFGAPYLQISKIHIFDGLNKKCHEKSAYWEFPYKKLSYNINGVYKQSGIFFLCEASCKAPQTLFREQYSSVVNGHQDKELFDCKRGLHGFFMDMKDDLEKALVAPVKKDTVGSRDFFLVCLRVTGDSPYNPQ